MPERKNSRREYLGNSKNFIQGILDIRGAVARVARWDERGNEQNQVKNRQKIQNCQSNRMSDARKSKYLKIITKNSIKYTKRKINPKNILYFNEFLEIATTHAADDGESRQI